MDHDLAMFMDRGDETSAEWAQITRPKKEREGGEIEIEREATVKCNIKSSNLVYLLTLAMVSP